MDVTSDRTISSNTLIIDDQGRALRFDLEGIAPGEISEVPGIVPRLTAVLTTDLTFDTANEEKIIAFDYIEKSSGITLSDGEIEFTHSGRYKGEIVCQVNESSDPTFILWIEVKPLSTGVWELNDGMSKVRIRDDSGYSISMGGSIEIQAGDKIRIKGKITSSQDTLVLQGVSETLDLGVNQQPSALIDIFRVGDLTP